MKFLLEEPTCRLYNSSAQEQIDALQRSQLADDEDCSSSITTFQTVLTNRIFPSKKFDNVLGTYINSSLNEKQFNRFCSSLTKRIQACSLSYHATMAITAITSFSEEQTSSVEYENTYLSSEETSQSDDASSLTTITSSLPNEVNSLEPNTSVYADTTILDSDIDEISEEMTPNGRPYEYMEMSFDLQNLNEITNEREIISIPISLSTSGSSFTGIVHAIKYTIITEEEEEDDQQTLSDDDNVSPYSEQSHRIRSTTDVVSLNSSMTSTMQYEHCPMMCFGEQLNQQRKASTSGDDESDDDDYIIIGQQKPVVHFITMNNETEEDYDEHFESARLFDNEPLTSDFSDQSVDFEDFRYSADLIRSSQTSGEPITASTTLRQEAIAITKVRCKQRSCWVRSPTPLEDNSANLIQSFAARTSAVGADAASACPNSNMNTITCTNTAASMSLHKQSNDCNKTEQRNGETPSYGFVQLNHDPRSIKTDESIVSPISKTNSIHDKDASPASKKTDNFYLIHHQSSLIPIKDLLDQNLNANIEIIQMDEQECILEIVDGVVTLVPKEKSVLPTVAHSDKEKFDGKQENSIEYDTSHNDDSSKRTERSSSATSSISTPPLSEHEPESEARLSSASLSNREENEAASEPFILQRDLPLKSPASQPHTEQSVDLLDLFSTPPVPSSNSHTENNNGKPAKNLLDDSLSSASSFELDDPAKSPRSGSPEREGKASSPIPPLTKSPSSSSLSIKDDSSPASPSYPISEPLESVPLADEPSPVDESDVNFPLPKAEPPPVAKPINKARINEFATLLSASVHLAQPPPAIKKQEAPKTVPTNNRPPPSPSRSDEQSFSSIRSGLTSERDERESYHTVKSANQSEEEQTKKPIDARYNEKIDDRNSIRINTSNIKALFEQKISDTNKSLSQSNEHLLHSTETKQQPTHKKVPISYGSLKRNLPINPLPTNQATVRRQSYQDTLNMNKYTDHVAGTKDVVIEDKQPESVQQTAHYGQNIRRHNTEEIIRPGVASARTSPDSAPNGHRSESLIAREIRETREKEEELRRQRRNCGLPEDASSLFSLANNDPLKSDTVSAASTKAPVKSSSFLSNLDFFTAKENSLTTGAIPSRRSTTSINNIVYDSHTSATPDDSKPTTSVVAQELSRFNNNGIPIIRTSSTNNYIHRSSSNQNILAASNTNNIIQREIEAIRAKEAELRQLGRIQHTSDEHSDPRKYQEQVPTLSKSQSSNTLATGKVRRDTERIQRPMIATANGFLQPKSASTKSTVSSIRGKFPSPNPTAPIIRSSNETTDYSKLSSADRLELEKREAQEREQELKKQRHSLVGVASSVNGDSGNASQDEHDDDQERYSDKIERLKRKENEKAQAPLVRPTRKLDMSQRWEQMLTNKTGQHSPGDALDDDNIDD